VKLGILIEVEEGLDWDSWRATCAAAERLGFESLWLSDHLESPWGTRQRLETWTALAVAAAETRRVVLGPLVTPVSFREPAIVARMAESLASLSSGRFVVGLGLGWNLQEHARASISFPSPIERGKRLQETIERIKCADPSLPVLIGGSGARIALPLVARYADQWNMTTASVSAFARASAQLDELCAQTRRPTHQISRSIACGVLIGRDAQDLDARAQHMRSCVPPLADAGDVLAAARGMGWLVGTLAELRSSLHEFAASGAERVIFGHYDLADLSTLELLAGLA
jgi:alkanesulfonate monooxygenase SsuD/methylene tetrahydromethanopterin reductase-like flavin-dependent oxidoreductase (luciferase family)